MRATIKRVDGRFYRDYQLYFDGWFVALVMVRLPSKRADYLSECRVEDSVRLRMLRRVQRGLNRAFP